MALPPFGDVDLGEFEGQKIVGTTIKVTNAGDGLSDALEIDPLVMHHDEEVFLVLKCRVAKVNFPPAPKDEDGVLREHVLKAGDSAIVDEKLVKKAIDEQAEKTRKAREEAAGIQSLLDEQAAIEAEEAQAAREAAGGES